LMKGTYCLGKFRSDGYPHKPGDISGVCRLGEWNSSLILGIRFVYQSIDLGGD